jgi:hypothetical protein
MAAGSEERARTSPRAWLLWALATLVVLGLGTVLRGGALLVHDHGESGAHVHALGNVAAEVASEHAHASSGAEPAEESVRSAAPADARDPQGVLLVLPAPVSLAALGCEPAACPPALVDVATLVPPSWEGSGARAHTGAGPPGPVRCAKQRSGVAALLTTSRALLL